MMIGTWAAAHNFKESFEDLSPAQINALSFEDFARLSGRPSPAQAAIAALDARYEATNPQTQTPPATQAAPGVPADPEPVDITNLSMQEYAQFRQQAIRTREYGFGALDQAGGSAEWIEAARSRGGRDGMVGRNVQAAPQIQRAFIQTTQVEGRQTMYRGA